MTTDLKTTTDVVKYILENYPDTRNSDNTLYIMVLRHEGAKHGIDFNKMSVFSFFMKIKELDVPSIETVGRCRRKIVESHPELAGDGNVEAGRMLNEETFRKYARGYV
ncbi:hypothetical protein [Bacillus infantis]|uniref:hypothetical protein n=1 Tax=Bacillus infantis TaxID=324767 RepID=UPI003CEFB0DE